jgi:hypothetical protein
MGEWAKRRKNVWVNATKWHNRIALGKTSNLDAPCLSAVVSGMRDEGGKGRPNEFPSVAVASVTIQDLSAMCGEVTHAAYEQPFGRPFRAILF